VSQSTSLWRAARRALQTLRQEWRGRGTRAYDAAKFNRLTSDWAFLPISANRELRQSLRTLRNRSRERGQNDDYVKKFLGMVVNNVPGPNGFTLQLTVVDATPTRPEQQKLVDDKLIQLVQEAFAEWAHKENASASRKLSWVDQQRLFIRTIARDGEVLVRKVLADNPFGFALKFIDVAWLDEFYNETLPNGNRILMSVEVDQYDRPIAYWLTQPPSDYLFNARAAGAPFRQRVDASEFIHAFLVLEDESQVRGVPWAHTAMARLKILGGYEEAELVAARIGACKMAWIIQPRDKDEPRLEAEIDPVTGKPVPVDVPEEMQPGITSILPVGYDVKDSNPQHPNANYSAFGKAVLRGICSGLEVSYASLSNDLEGANYSSLKAGQQEERAYWRSLQQFQIEHFNRIVFAEWIKTAMLSGALAISESEYRRLRASWRPRGWPSIEPLKEVQATILGINNFLDSRTDDAGERGDDWLETLAELAAEDRAIDQAGMKILPVETKPTVTKESKDEIKADDPANDTPADDGTSRVLPMFEDQLRPRLRA
jgi:lambda family phage portal protein